MTSITTVNQIFAKQHCTHFFVNEKHLFNLSTFFIKEISKSGLLSSAQNFEMGKKVKVPKLELHSEWKQKQVMKKSILIFFDDFEIGDEWSVSISDLNRL